MYRIYKIVITIVILTMFINFMTTVGVGVYKTIHGLTILYTEGMTGRPGLELVESLDIFMIGLVFLIISLGFMKLFLPEFAWFKKFDLPWLKINDFFDLKQVVWYALLLTLLITFGTRLVKSDGQWEWNLLVVPAAVLLFALSAKFMRH